MKSRIMIVNKRPLFSTFPSLYFLSLASAGVVSALGCSSSATDGGCAGSEGAGAVVDLYL